MKAVPQEILKEYVKSQNFASTAEIVEAIKEMFRDVIQTALEVKLDEELGRERYSGRRNPEARPILIIKARRRISNESMETP